MNELRKKCFGFVDEDGGRKCIILQMMNIASPNEKKR